MAGSPFSVLAVTAAAAVWSSCLVAASVAASAHGVIDQLLTSKFGHRLIMRAPGWVHLLINSNACNILIALSFISGLWLSFASFSYVANQLLRNHR